MVYLYFIYDKLKNQNLLCKAWVEIELIGMALQVPYFLIQILVYSQINKSAIAEMNKRLKAVADERGVELQDYHAADSDGEGHSAVSDDKNVQLMEGLLSDRTREKRRVMVKATALKSKK